MNSLEEILARAASEAPVHAADLTTVRRRARSIRRRRLAAGAAGTAAAIAVVAGLGFAFGSGGNDAAPPITAKPSRSSNGLPTFRIAYDVPADQTSGATPGVPYWHGGELNAPDGTRISFAVPPLAVVHIPLAKSWAVETKAGPNGYRMNIVDATGRDQTAPDPSAHGLVGGRDGFAWLTVEHGKTHLRTSGTHFPDIAVGPAEDDSALLGMFPDLEVGVRTGDDGAVRIDKVDIDTGQLTPQPSPPYGARCGGWVYGSEADFVNGCPGLVPLAYAADGSSAWALEKDANVEGEAEPLSPNAASTLVLRSPSGLQQARFDAPAGGFFGNETWDGNRLLVSVWAPPAAGPVRGVASGQQGTWYLAWLTPQGFTVARSTAVAGGGNSPAYVVGVEVPGTAGASGRGNG